MAGKFLAMDSPVDADIVVGVPESGNVAAMGICNAGRNSLRNSFCKE